MKQSVKHSKIKNTGILFELLTRQVTADILNANEKSSKAVKLVKKYFIECNEDFISNIDNINSQELSVVVLRSVEILYNYFLESKAAQSLILINSTILPVSKEAFNQLAKSVQVFVEKNLNLPEIFNRDGVFRVYTQIIISIFSLNTRESGSLNEVGKIEANRAAYAYMLNWLNQSS